MIQYTMVFYVVLISLCRDLMAQDFVRCKKIYESKCSMASKYTLTDDIIKNHTERILNLRKFYPFFTLAEGTFSQYKEGVFRFLDMGYITLAVLRYFINENSFNDSPVTYSGYSEFCREMLSRDFDVTRERFAKDEIDELIRYIFDKMRNYGKAFEFDFYDPAERKQKVARVRLIDSTVRENEVVYTITEDGIEFYLTTKEVRDESRINMDQILLEKLIKSENFRGSIDVIERINIEVKALEKYREEVVELLLSDVHEGAKAVDEYVERTSVWFAEERKSFARNRELVDKAVARLTFGSDAGDSKTARDITRLQTMLKQTIENHSNLIAATAELSRFSDEMIRRSRVRSLRASFDYESALNRMVAEDCPQCLAEFIEPLLLPKRHKSLAISTIDNIVLQRTAESLKGEERKELKADLNFKYDDELLNESVSMNFAKLFKELLGRLQRWDRVTLKEYGAILEVKFGMDIYRNRDYYAFLTHLAGKDSYSVKEITENSETFLEEMVVSGMTEDELESFQDMAFKIEFGNDLVKMKLDQGSTEEIAEITDMTFIKM